MDMEEAEQLAMVNDQLLRCCLCKHLLRDAVQLTCLHSCCKQCFSIASTSNGCISDVACGLCGTKTVTGAEQPNGFVDRQVQRYTSIAESRVCGICKGDGEAEKPAVLWCPTCCLSLCGYCTAAHRLFNRQHVTKSLEELESLEAMRSMPLASSCPIHKKPLDVACLYCEQAKCISCWAECLEKNHTMLVAGKESFDKYVGQFIESIRSMETDLLRKAEILDKPQSILRDTKAGRTYHLEQVFKRKRCIADAVEMAYAEIEIAIKNAYDELEADGNVAVAAGGRIASSLSDTRNYIKRLLESNDKCEILNQQKIIRERLSVLSTDVDTLSNKIATMRQAVSCGSLLPDDFHDKIRQWIGMPVSSSVSSSVFGTASASHQLPTQCCDVALTHDGRLLLAAWQHGLYEFSSASLQELSRWQPPTLISGSDEAVRSVAALSDGRAAVGLLFSQLVILLRRCEEAVCSSPGAAAAAWTEELRLDQLPWRTRWLAAHGDVLAVTESRRTEQQQNTWVPGMRLQLLSISSGRRLTAERRREYGIRSLAVSDRVVVTGSWEQVQLGDGRSAVQVLDAHSLSDSDERLWRYELSSSTKELLWGVCTDSVNGCLYAAVWSSDLSSGRVCALSMSDGSELRHVALSFGSACPQQPQLLPVRLSFSDGTAEHQLCRSRGRSRHEEQLAVLCWDSTSKEFRTVTVHRCQL